jgi:hypothetical protein
VSSGFYVQSPTAECIVVGKKWNFAKCSSNSYERCIAIVSQQGKHLYIKCMSTKPKINGVLACLHPYYQ